MLLTWKDGITSILALGVVSMIYADSRGVQLPLISGYRWEILALLILGVAMCAIGSNAKEAKFKTSWSKVISAIAIASLMIGILGLITGASWAFVSLATLILLLWIATTARHVVSN